MTQPTTLTIAEIIERTTAFFQQKGIDTARLDAQLLVAHALGKSRLELYLHFDYPLNDDELARTRELVRRRGAREPVAYIVGEREFAGRSFKVAPGVLIPRPDTETLVEQAQALVDAQSSAQVEDGGSIHLLEFGVGSGAVAVTLAADNPRVRVIATEISTAAAEVARENARRHGVDDRVEIRVQGDFAGIDGLFDGLVSNPPYIDRAEEPTLAPEVAQYEPHEALFAAGEGLAWYEFLAREAMRLVRPGGFVAVEIGHTQAERVREIFAEAGLAEIKVAKDLAGRDRVVVGGR